MSVEDSIAMFNAEVERHHSIESLREASQPARDKLTALWKAGERGPVYVSPEDWQAMVDYMRAMDDNLGAAIRPDPSEMLFRRMMIVRPAIDHDDWHGEGMAG